MNRNELRGISVNDIEIMKLQAKAMSGNIKMLNLLDYMHQWLFPQHIQLIVEKFSEDTLIDCINEGLVCRSASMYGTSPEAMASHKDYIELSEKGRLLLKKNQK